MSPADQPPQPRDKPVHMTEEDVDALFEGVDWQSLVAHMDDLFIVHQPRVVVAWPMHLHKHGQGCGRA